MGRRIFIPTFSSPCHLFRDALVFGMKPLYGVPILYNIGAITGAIFFGHISEKIARRYAVMAALVLSLLSIPAWAFGGSTMVIVLGSYLMQTGVQGAFGGYSSAFE